MKDKPTNPCHACGSTDYWFSPGGEWLCRKCHPQPFSSSFSPVTSCRAPEAEGREATPGPGHLLSIFLLVLLPLLFFGCGSPTEDYHDLAKENVKLQEEVNALKQGHLTINQNLLTLRGNYDTKTAEYNALAAQYTVLSFEKEYLQLAYDDLAAALAGSGDSTASNIAAVEEAREDLIALNDALVDLQGKLDELTSIYPPTNFNSIAQLIEWFTASNSTGCVNLQSRGFNDGFIINIEPGYGFCTAVAGNKLYRLNPGTTNSTEIRNLP